MTRLRKRIAERLKEAQNTAAMLTTFNEVDMTNVMAARERYRDAFEKKYGARLGFMGFFVKSCIVALQEIPAVNAQIDGDDLVYKNHYDIGVAVGTEQGLVVPVLRDADRLGFAEVESGIGELGRKARDGKLTMEELMPARGQRPGGQPGQGGRPDGFRPDGNGRPPAAGQGADRPQRPTRPE